MSSLTKTLEEIASFSSGKSITPGGDGPYRGPAIKWTKSGGAL